MAGMTQTKLRIIEITQFDPHFWDLNTLYKGVKTNFSGQQSSLICSNAACALMIYGQSFSKVPSIAKDSTEVAEIRWDRSKLQSRVSVLHVF